MGWFQKAPGPWAKPEPAIAVPPWQETWTWLDGSEPDKYRSYLAVRTAVLEDWHLVEFPVYQWWELDPRHAAWATPATTKMQTMGRDVVSRNYRVVTRREMPRDFVEAVINARV